MAQFIHACGVDGVVNGGAAACARLENFVAQGSGIAGEFLDHLRLVVKGHDEGFVFVMAQDAEEEIGGGVLFEFQAVANAVGSVEQHSYAQRKIGLPAEIANFLRGFIVKNFEVVFFQVGDEFVAAVQHGEQNVHEVDAALDYGGVLAGGRGWRVIVAGAGLEPRAGARIGGGRGLLRGMSCRQKQYGDERECQN